MIEIEISPSVPNPIVKQSAATSSDVDMSPHSSSSSSSSPVNDNAVETDVFPQELLDWILANQCTSFEKMQRKTMQPSAYSEVDAMQYWLTRANAESTHGTHINTLLHTLYIDDVIQNRFMKSFFPLRNYSIVEHSTVYYVCMVAHI